MERLRVADQQSETDVADASVLVLDAMYHLWEAWAHVLGTRDLSKQNLAVALDPAGRTAAALMAVRGRLTHELVEPRESLGFGTQPFGTSPFGVGGWYWRSLGERAGDRSGMRERLNWYENEVAGREVIESTVLAYGWFAAQPGFAAS
ncbi:hypothetical protein SAMN06272737_14611 [Blastococcus mobilis]|uniref:Uncharacterized protein n=2 Tax=Blastococcus mobilis TaxID=1938746 RepID=A0A239AK33_9ACTN|nr:hypothetical protein SAMN06272737_14611 [Blastococcus mobilis]